MPIAIQDTPHALLTELSIILCKTIATWWALRSELDTYATTASNPLCVATTTGVFIKDMGKTTQTVPYPFVSPTPHCLFRNQNPRYYVLPLPRIRMPSFIVCCYVNVISIGIGPIWGHNNIWHIRRYHGN